MRSDAKENQREILDCARQLFNNQGVDEVSMNQIAKTLGIGAGTLYRHYTNKSELCMALVYDDLATFIGESQHYLERTADSPQIQFRTTLSRYLEFREGNRELLINVDAGTESTSGSYFYASDLYQAVCAVFAQILHAATPKLTTQTCQFRADMLLAMLKSDAYAYQRQIRQVEQSQLVDEITELFLEQ